MPIKNKRKTNRNKSSKKNKASNPKLDNHNPRVRNRSHTKRKKRQRKFIRRRIGLSLILLVLIFFGVSKITRALNSYKVMGYPSFRDEVLNSLSSEVFVSPSKNRSLSTAEKLTDFDNLYEIIYRTYAIDELNREDFEKFHSEYQNYKKKIASSKTDQDYFSLLDEYLEVLDDTRTFILDKETYDNLFDYYRNMQNSPIKDALENPQSVDRYKRLIQNSKKPKPSIKAELVKKGLVSIKLSDFKPLEYEDDLKMLTELFAANAPIGTLIIDLSDNNSIDNKYWNKFAKILINADYTESNIVFYRSKLFEDTLANIKENEDIPYKSAYVKNDASKYPEAIDSIDKEEYIYYDQVSLNIARNNEYALRKIYVLTNSNTANEAIKFAHVLQKSGAYVVKNTIDPSPTYKDVIYNIPSDLYVLEHSGLILSINDAYAKNEDDKYLEYNQKINSKDPISAMLQIIN